MARGKARIKARSMQREITTQTGVEMHLNDVWRTMVPERLWVATLVEEWGWPKALQQSFTIIKAVQKAGYNNADRWSVLEQLDRVLWWHIKERLGHRNWNTFGRATAWLWRDLGEGERTDVFGVAEEGQERREERIVNAAQLVREREGKGRAILLTVPLTALMIAGKYKTTVPDPAWEHWEEMVRGEDGWEVTASRTRAMAVGLAGVMETHDGKWTERFWKKAATVGACKWNQTEVMLIY